MKTPDPVTALKRNQTNQPWNTKQAQAFVWCLQLPACELAVRTASWQWPPWPLQHASLGQHSLALRAAEQQWQESLQMSINVTLRSYQRHLLHPQAP